MKKINTVKSLYLLLIPKIIGILEVIFLLIFTDTNTIDDISSNSVFIIVNCLLAIIIYLNVTSLNKDFKKFAIFKSICILLDLFLLALNQFSVILFLDLYLIESLRVLKIILCIPTVYYFYKGFYSLTKEKKSKIYIFWKKFGIINVCLAIFSNIEFLLSLFSTTAHFISQSIIFIILFGLVLPLLSFVLELLEIIYIIKTVILFSK